MPSLNSPDNGHHEIGHETPQEFTDRERVGIETNVGMMGLAYERYTTGDTSAWGEVCRRAISLGEYANRTRTKEEIVDDVERILTDDQLDALDEPDVIFRSGGQASLRMPDGTIETVGGSDEVEELAQIRNRLEATAAIGIDTEEFNDSYLAPYNGTFVLERERLENDIQWLSDRKRIGPNVPEDRQAVFVAYRDTLAQLVLLNNRDFEQTYRATRGSILAEEMLVRQYCRDPESIVGAGKFALLSAVSLLTLLWTIRDVRKGSPSVSTLIGIGGVMYLLNSGGSRYNFLRSEQFARLARGPLDGDAVADLQDFAMSSEDAYGHLLSTLRKYKTVDSLTQEHIDAMMYPMDNEGNPIAEREVPQEIAELCLGQSATDCLGVFEGIRATAQSAERDAVIDFAEAVHDGQVAGDATSI